MKLIERIASFRRVGRFCLLAVAFCAAQNLYAGWGWTGGGTDSNWTTDANWDKTLANTGYFFRNSQTAFSANTVNFTESVGISAHLWVDNGTSESAPIVFTATDDSFGLTDQKNVVIGLTTTDDGYLDIQRGTYTCKVLQVGNNAADPSGSGWLRLGGNGENVVFNTSDTLLLHRGTIIVKEGATMTASSYLSLGETAGATASHMEIDGGTVANSGKYLTVGSKAPATVVIKNGGTYNNTAGTGSLVIASRAAGTLTVDDGGTVNLKGHLIFCYAAESGAGVFNLKSGGLLVANSVYVQADHNGGTALFNFDGGTFRAYADNATFIKDDTRLMVSVTGNGGTIDTAGHTLTITAPIADAPQASGVMHFVGGGSVSFAAAPGWTGGTTVEAGTSLTVADDTAKDALLAGGLSVVWPEGGPACAGPVTVLSVTGGTVSDADLEKVTFADASSVPAGVTIRKGSDGKSVELFVPTSVAAADFALSKTTPYLVFEGATLADLATHTLRARMGGNHFDDDGAEATFFNRVDTNDGGVLTKVTYQLQAIDAGYVKCAKVDFTEGEGGVYAKLADGNFASYNSSFNTFGTDITNGAADRGYIPYGLKIVEPATALSVNFTVAADKVLDTSSDVRYGAGDYAVPYSSWANMSGASGTTAVVGGATFEVVNNSKGPYQCSALNPSTDVRHGYIDDSASAPTPTVKVTNIPYDFYRVVAYFATDTDNGQFGYATINGKNYTGTTDATVAGTDAWGAAGAQSKAKGLREGVNYLVSDVTSGSTATIVGHRFSSSVRGCIAAVQIVQIEPASTYTATIDTEDQFDLSTLDWDNQLPAPLPEGAMVVVNVEADATLDIDAALEAFAVEFNVSDGVTLTLAGNNISADFLSVKGQGQVAVAGASQLSGKVVGDGTLVYTATPASATFTDPAWTGVLWIRNCAVAGLVPGNMAGENSTLRLTGVTGYFNNGGTAAANPQVSAGTLELLDDGDTPAFTVNNGWSDYGVTVFARLAGSGTLAVANKDIYQRYVFKDASGFQGVIDTSSRYLRVIFGDGASLSPTAGTVTVVSGAEATVGSGATWKTRNGFVVEGTLNLESGATLTGAVTGSGRLVALAAEEVPELASLTASGWTGVVEVRGAETAQAMTASSATQFMNAGSGFVLTEGHLALTSGEGLTGTVDVREGATLYVMDQDSGSLSLKAGDVAGTINLAMCAATELSVDLGSGAAATHIVYPSTVETMNLTLSEALAQDGEITVPLSGASSVATVNATVLDQNGTAKPAAAEVSGATATVTFAPSVSGKACWIAYEMDYQSGVTGKTGYENTGTDTTGLNSDSGITGDNAFYNGMLYTYSHPWRNITYPADGNWTAVVRCTVPAYENAAVITFGTKTGGLIGLVAGADPETEMRLVQTTGDSHFVTNATMTVQNATTAQHVYIFSVESNQTVKVYCDGTQVLDKTFETPFTIGGGIQVGTVHGGMGNTAIVPFAKNEAPANTLTEETQKAARIDCVRLYKEILGPNAIAQLSVEFPAVKLFQATISGGSSAWGDLAWTGGDIATADEYSTIIVTVEDDATLALPASLTAADLKFSVADGKTLTLVQATGGTTLALGSPMEVNGGAIEFDENLAFGDLAVGGTGTLVLGDGVTIDEALSGTAKLGIAEGATVTVATGGSVAKTLTGAGTLDFSGVALPAALTFSDWTGTVVIPAVTSGAAALNLNGYGVAGSTVRVTGVSGGAWLASAAVLPTIDIPQGAALTLNAFSASYANTFNKLTGSGTFALAADGTTDGYVDGFFLVKDVSSFDGSITVAAPGLAIGAAKPASPATFGQIVVTTSAAVGPNAAWSAPNGIVLASADATLTVVSGGTAPEPTTSVEHCFVQSEQDGFGATVYSVAENASMTDPEGNEITDQTVLAWLESYSATQEDINELTMEEFTNRYLLNMDPTKSCAAELKITSVSLADGIVTVGVELVRSEDNLSVGTRRINGILKLYGSSTLAADSFSDLGAGSYDMIFEMNNTPSIEFELPPTNPPAFFKAVIVPVE